MSRLTEGNTLLIIDEKLREARRMAHAAGTPRLLDSRVVSGLLAKIDAGEVDSMARTG